MKQSWFLFFMMVALILGAALPAAVQGNELPSSTDGSSESATSVAPELLFLLLRGSAEDEEKSSDIEDSDEMVFLTKQINVVQPRLMLV